MEEQAKDEDASSRKKKWYKISIIRIGILFFSICAVMYIIILFNQIRLEEGAERGPNSVARWTLLNAIDYQKIYYLEYNKYADSIDELLESDYGFSIDDGVIIKVLSASNENFSMLSFHKSGNKIYITTWSEKMIEEYKK